MNECEIQISIAISGFSVKAAFNCIEMCTKEA